MSTCYVMKTAYDAGNFAPNAGCLVAANQIEAVTSFSLSHRPTNFPRSYPINALRFSKSSVVIFMEYKKMAFLQQCCFSGCEFSLLQIVPARN